MRSAMRSCRSAMPPARCCDQAVTETKSLDHDVLAKYIHANSFKTVVGDLSFGKDGEWSKPRELF